VPVPESTALLFGSVLRMVTADSASIWVRTGHPATVEVPAGTATGRERLDRQQRARSQGWRGIRVGGRS